MSKNVDKTPNEKMIIENLLNPLNSSSNLRNIGVEIDQDLEEIRKIPLDQKFLNDFFESASNSPTASPNATPTSSPKNCSNSPLNLSNSSLSSTSNFLPSPLYRSSSNASNLSFNSRSQS